MNRKKRSIQYLVGALLLTSAGLALRADEASSFRYYNPVNTYDTGKDKTVSGVFIEFENPCALRAVISLEGINDGKPLKISEEVPTVSGRALISFPISDLAKVTITRITVTCGGYQTPVDNPKSGQNYGFCGSAEVSTR